jgi:hypothetical protein
MLLLASRGRMGMKAVGEIIQTGLSDTLPTWRRRQ